MTGDESNIQNQNIFDKMRNSKDKIIEIGNIFLSGIPIAGGPITRILDMMKENNKKLIIRLVNDIKADLERLDIDIKNYIHSSEYISFLQKSMQDYCISSVEKRTVIKVIVLNSTIKDIEGEFKYDDELEQLYFLSTSLTIQSMYVLLDIYQAALLPPTDNSRVLPLYSFGDRFKKFDPLFNYTKYYTNVKTNQFDQVKLYFDHLKILIDSGLLLPLFRQVESERQLLHSGRINKNSNWMDINSSSSLGSIVDERKLKNSLQELVKKQNEIIERLNNTEVKFNPLKMQIPSQIAITDIGYSFLDFITEEKIEPSDEELPNVNLRY